MTSRRDVIKGSVAATTALFGAGSAMAKSGDRDLRAAPIEPVHQISSIIYETQVRQARAFAAAASARGIAAHGIEGDVTPLWYGRLDREWKSGPRPIAGMTGHGVLFVLERLAWEKGMRVVFRAEHVPGVKGGIDHKFEGPGRLMSRAAQMDDGWAEAMAELISLCPVKKSGKATLAITTGGAIAQRFEDDRLVSWIIAPMDRTGFPRT